MLPYRVVWVSLGEICPPAKAPKRPLRAPSERESIMTNARFVIREGLWGRTAHDIIRREDIASPDGEGMGSRIFVRCSSTPLYWWDAVSDTTQKADILCNACVQWRRWEATRMADIANAVGRLSDDLGSLTFMRSIDGLGGTPVDWEARNADSLEVLCLRRESAALMDAADALSRGRF